MDIISAVGDFINITKNKINELAKKNGFKKRESKIKPESFVIAITTGQFELHEITLDTLAGKIEEIQDGTRVTKQALFERMEAGEKLMKEVYTFALNNFSQKYLELKNIEVLRQFKDVKINDGSTISLPDKLKDVFKGHGGKNADSAVKIQATYSVIKNEFVGLDWFDATKNDTTYNEETLKTVKAGELIIKDLGYFNGEYFQKINTMKAYFISRIKTNTLLYTINKGEYETIDFYNLLRKAQDDIDQKMYMKLTTGEMLEIRFTAIKLPQKKSDERKRKAYKNAEKNGRQLTAREIQSLDWFIVITNVSEDMLSIETICELYRLRWQIELQFKALKSSLDFEKFSKAGEYYFKCLFYGKMIMALFTLKLYSICRTIKFKECGRLVSIQKFVRNFRNKINLMVIVSMKPTKNKLQKFEKTILNIAEKSFFDKRKRKTTEEILMQQELPKNPLKIMVISNF